MTEKKPKTTWRSWAHMDGEDLVEMPRSLALDLIRALTITSHVHESSDEDCEAGLHERRFEAHCDRMERIANTLSAHLCDEGLTPTADLMLRSFVMAYEAAPDIPAA